MADWDDPDLTSVYSDVLSELKARDVDAASMAMSPTNPPVGFIRYNSGLGGFQVWNGSTWSAIVFSITVGGTGAQSASTARTALGLGTLATQSAGAVAITGGTISGITALSLVGNLAFDIDGSRNIGTNAVRAGGVYIKNGLRLPVGPDKFLTS